MSGRVVKKKAKVHDAAVLAVPEVVAWIDVRLSFLFQIDFERPEKLILFESIQ